MGGIGVAALIGLALIFGSKKSSTNATTTKVTFGTAKILPKKAATPAAQKVRVNIGPAVIKPKPVHAKVPTSVHDTTAVAVNAAKPAGAAPIPNPTAARKVAQSVADHYRANRKKYDHGRVSTFQAFAGLKPDGIYGPKTAQALRQYGALKVVG